MGNVRFCAVQCVLSGKWGARVSQRDRNGRDGRKRLEYALGGWYD